MTVLHYSLKTVFELSTHSLELIYGYCCFEAFQKCLHSRIEKCHHSIRMSKLLLCKRLTQAFLNKPEIFTRVKMKTQYLILEMYKYLRVVKSVNKVFCSQIACGISFRSIYTRVALFPKILFKIVILHNINSRDFSPKP